MEVKRGLDLKHLKWDTKEKKYNEITAETPTIFQKIAACCFQLWGFDLEQDSGFTGNIDISIKRRNQFIHPSNNELEGSFKHKMEKIYAPVGFKLLMEQLAKVIQKF